MKVFLCAVLALLPIWQVEAGEIVIFQGDCGHLLVEPNYTTPRKIDKSMSKMIAIFKALEVQKFRGLSVPEKERFSEEVLTKRLLDDLYDLWRQFYMPPLAPPEFLKSHIRVRELWQESRREFLRNLLPKNGGGDPLERYGDSYDARRYREFLSPTQGLFATLMTAYAAADAYLSPTLPLDIMDLGAGIGDSTKALKAFYPKARITAVDGSPAFLEELGHELPDVRLVQHDFRQPRLPVEDESMDMVVSFTSAGPHLEPEQFSALLPEIYRALRVGGYLLMEFRAGYTKAVPSAKNVQEFVAHLEKFGFEQKSRPFRAVFRMPKNDYFPVLVTKGL